MNFTVYVHGMVCRPWSCAMGARWRATTDSPSLLPRDLENQCFIKAILRTIMVINLASMASREVQKIESDHSWRREKCAEDAGYKYLFSLRPDYVLKRSLDPVGRLWQSPVLPVVDFNGFPRQPRPKVGFFDLKNWQMGTSTIHVSLGGILYAI